MKFLDIFKKTNQPKTFREFMAIHGFKTQRDLARFLGISESYISLFMTGKYRFGKKMAKKISKKTGIPWENLL